MAACTGDALMVSNDCLGEADASQSAYCAEASIAGKTCDFRYAGKFGLSDASRSALPAYCMEPGAKIKYSNEEGEVIEFIIESKGFVEGHEFVPQHIPCEDDTTEMILDCIDYERAYVILRSEPHTFMLELLTMPDTYDKTHGLVGDFLWISREEVKNYFVKEFSMVVDQRSLSYPQEPCLEFLSSVMLNGKNYQGVICFDEDLECRKYQYFVNHELGLLAFRRSDGVLWTLSE